MMQVIESMESRTLLSASAAVITADLEALAADAANAKVEMPAALATAKTDLATLKADVAAAAGQLTKAQKSANQKVLNALVKAESGDMAKYKSKATAVFSSASSVGKQLVGKLKSLESHPGNSGIEKSVGALLGKLENIFSASAVAAVELQVSTATADIDANLDDLAAAVPTAQADVTTTKSHFAAAQSELSTGLTTTQADIAKLASDLM